MDKWATSLDKLANYTETLGIIDQIDFAWERQRKVIKNSGYVEDGYGVSVQGPNVSSIDFEPPGDSKIKIPQIRHEAILSRIRQRRPITELVLKYAKDLAELEAEERIDEVLGYLNEDIVEKMKDEIDRRNEEDNQDLEL